MGAISAKEYSSPLVACVKILIQPLFLPLTLPPNPPQKSPGSAGEGRQIVSLPIQLIAMAFSSNNPERDVSATNVKPKQAS
jgi:hypothetical protein